MGVGVLEYLCTKQTFLYFTRNKIYKYAFKVILGTNEKLSNMPIRKKILITGASGLLGANLVCHYAAKSNCTGWLLRKTPQF